ncbi:tetratricopeptide repeat protein [Paenibacillus oenotherae]|uniref:Tetratricopeptide repeat protein n=1 Tax=Paenibacillus oenotherae TaxID=1435645 RepID=A0ABS7DCB9_9BACL|nr:tetratricopeptide repeat protein [Paenibacillus oenotherae]MBW7477556.1 tetratricopeptide repeat protein [Paenibacillus oenotherae]
MRVWNILGIEPTDDVKSIKRAYARLLKIHHPEDDPQGYQRLREAYDLAIKLAKQSGHSSSTRALKDSEDEAGRDIEGSAGDDAGQGAAYSGSSDYEAEAEDEIPAELRNSYYLEWDNKPDPESQLNLFIHTVEHIYNDMQSRMNKANWLELLNADIVWNASMRAAVSDRLLHFLEGHYFLPAAIWELLDGTFHWSNQDLGQNEELAHEFPAVYAYMSAKSNELNMDYSYLLRAGNIDYETYLRHREAACLALLNDELEKAEKSLQQAAAIFNEDLELVLLQIECFKRMGDHERWLASCSHRIALDPNALNGYYNRAAAYYECSRLAEALRDLRFILNLGPNDRDGLSLAGQCYWKMGDMEQAQEMFKRLLAVDRDDAVAILALMQLKAQEERKIRKNGGPGKREVLKGLRQELGRIPFAVRFLRGVRLFISRSWLTLILLIIFKFILFIACMSYIDDTQVIANREELMKVPLETQAVRLTLSEAACTGYQGKWSERINGERDTGETVNDVNSFLSRMEAQNTDSGEADYLCIGNLQPETAVMVIMTKEQRDAMMSKPEFQFEGLVRSELMSMPWDQASLAFRDEVMKSGSAGKRLMNVYIDSRESQESGGDKAVQITMTLLLVFLVYISYKAFLQEFRRAWRFIAYN